MIGENDKNFGRVISAKLQLRRRKFRGDTIYCNGIVVLVCVCVCLLARNIIIAIAPGTPTDNCVLISRPDVFQFNL